MARMKQQDVVLQFTKRGALFVSSPKRSGPRSDHLTVKDMLQLVGMTVRDGDHFLLSIERLPAEDASWLVIKEKP